MILQKQSNFKVKRLGKEYSNLISNIDKGKRVRVRQGNTRVYINIPWNTSQRTIREKRATELLNLISKNRLIYDSEKFRQPAIKTINEKHEIVYVPLSDTGYSLYEIEQMRKI